MKHAPTIAGIILLASCASQVPARLQFRLADQTWLRPGLSVLRGLDSRGLDAPLLTARTTAVQLDLPVTF